MLTWLINRARSDFVRNVALLSVGTAIAQLLPLLASPILLRFYDAQSYGVYSLVLAASAILLPLFALKMDAAIAQARSKRERAALMFLGCFSALIFSFISSLFILAALLTKLLPEGIAEASYWLLAIPVLTIGNTLQNMLVMINVAAKAFRDVSIATVQKSMTLVLVQLACGVMGFGVAGLVAGSLIASIIANSRLLRNGRTFLGTRMPSRKHVFAAKRKFWDFAKFTMPSGVISALSLNLVIVFMSALFSASVAGQFALAQRCISAPMNLIGNAVSQVFLQRATTLAHLPKPVMAKFYWQTALVLGGFGLLVLWPIMIWPEQLFALVFGQDWRLAGQLVGLLVPLAAVRFAVSPASVVTHFFGMNAFGLFLQVVLVASSCAAFLLSYVQGFDPPNTVLCYALISSSAYVFFGLAVLYRLMRA